MSRVPSTRSSNRVWCHLNLSKYNRVSLEVVMRSSRLPWHESWQNYKLCVTGCMHVFVACKRLVISLTWLLTFPVSASSLVTLVVDRSRNNALPYEIAIRFRMLAVTLVSCSPGWRTGFGRLFAVCWTNEAMSVVFTSWIKFHVTCYMQVRWTPTVKKLPRVRLSPRILMRFERGWQVAVITGHVGHPCVDTLRVTSWVNYDAGSSSV